MPPSLSVIVPMHNEAGNAAGLVKEIGAALADIEHEIIVIDDCSTDATMSELKKLQSEFAQLRVLQHSSNAGQSRAIRSGVRASRAKIIATLDGDGQNDPADLPAIFANFTRDHAPDKLGMIQGNRKKRQDSSNKKWASKWANIIRKKLLDDGAPDSGCGLKIFSRQAFLELPYFDHMHRYMAFLMQREGYVCEFMPVRHHGRGYGQSNYTNLGRALAALSDLRAMRWLSKRNRNPGKVTEL